jgi:hypothetical protein
MAVATKTKIVKSRIKHQAPVCPLDWAKRNFSAQEIAFSNEAFFTARILRVPFSGRDVFLTLHPPKAGENRGMMLRLRVRNFPMVIGLSDLGNLAPLAPSLASLALEIYPIEMQHILLEAALDPILFQLQAVFREKITLETISDGTGLDGLETPIQCRFAIHGANPHGGEAVPCLLEGNLALSDELANRFITLIRSQDPAIYKIYEKVLPICHVNVASLAMSVDELKKMQNGDILLLEDSSAVEQNRRSLSGLDSCTILGKQDGDRLTVERIIFNDEFEETNS